MRRTVVIELSGHSLMAEAPDDVLDALIGFFPERGEIDRRARRTRLSAQARNASACGSLPAAVRAV